MKKMTGLIILLMLSVAPAFAGDQDFTLVNETGVTIHQLFCTPTTTNAWEEDILGVDVLKDGEKVDVKFSRDESAAEWDLMVVDEEGTKIEWTEIDLLEAAVITLYLKDGKATAEIQKAAEAEEETSAPAEGGKQDFTLVNDTGLTIDQLYCSPTTTSVWEEDILGVDVLPDGEKVNVSFSRTEKAAEWDLMIVDEEGDKIEWTEINLLEAETITLYYKDGKPTAEIQ